MHGNAEQPHPAYHLMLSTLFKAIELVADGCKASSLREWVLVNQKLLCIENRPWQAA